MVLFVGEQTVGYYVEEIAKEEVVFTGRVSHVLDMEKYIYERGYSRIMIDLKQLVDDPEFIQSEMKRLQVGYPTSFIFFALGYTEKSELLTRLVEAGFYYFITEPLAGRAKEQLRVALIGHATVEGAEEAEKKRREEEKTEYERLGLLSVAIAGCCHRIGTTTQAIQLCKYLQLKNRKACYVNLTGSSIMPWKGSAAEMTKDDELLSRIRINNVDLYDDPKKIPQIKDHGYDYIVYDFGDVHEKVFSSVQFLEKDIRIVVGGIKPDETRGMREVYDSLISDSTYYIFSFVSDEKKKETLEAQGPLADKTSFAIYVPDPFEFITKAQNTYQNIIEITKLDLKEDKKKGFFRRLGGR